MLPSDSGTSRKRSMNIRDARIAGLYDLEHTIGQGHFAVVKLARHVFTNEKVAVKIIDKTNLDPESAVHIMQEVRCMKLVQHSNIVRLYEVIDTQTKLFLILELGDYDMHDFILKHDRGVEEPLAQQYFCQIITAIDYCHRLHVVHRDLKPENVVFFEKLGMVKLTDFGFSNLYEPGVQLRTSCGSLAYSAPEILLGDAYDAPAVDIWSLGVILFMLVCGRLPFQETNDSETLTKILDCRYTIPDTLSNACRNLIQRLLIRDPSRRAKLDEIVANPWVAAGDRGHAEAIPLVVRHHLPNSVHTTIIEQMVAGGVGTEEEIINALENDEYNSRAATYFLLAERILASCREERAQQLMAQEASAVPEEELIESSDVRHSRPSTVASGSRCRSRSNSWRARPCTILKEESEDELSSYLKSASRQSSRNSSPSVSMFGGSSRDRISPQAVQDLLELSRISSGRRAISPDSVRSSRSPSPPATSSGRASPALSALSLSRLKVASTTLSGGMRKLSSSPHLLGICEEGEENEANGGASLLSAPSVTPIGRTNRSASTGLVHVDHGTSSSSSGHAILQSTKSGGASATPSSLFSHQATYRRYEQHQRFIARSRRSTSCSSSETSDDEEGKRLSLLGASKCRGHSRDSSDKPDDDNAGGGLGNNVAGSGGVSFAGKSGGTESSGGGKGTTECGGNAQDGGRANDASSLCGTTAQLRPIPEMTQLDSDKGERIRARILHRSFTAERILRHWAGLCVNQTSPAETSTFGTPPRELLSIRCPVSGDQWIRKLQTTKSLEDLRAPDKQEAAGDVSSVSDELVDDVYDDSNLSSKRERLSDSGCSSDNKGGKPEVDACEKKTSLSYLLYDQPRIDKVHVWLRNSQFV